MKKDAYYFSHDCNARHDPKILALMSSFGWEGYGMYWAIVEILREQPDYKYPFDKTHLIALQRELGIELPRLEMFLETCNEYGLFIKENGYIYSESLLSRMALYNQKRLKRIEAGRKGAESKWQNHGNAMAMLEQPHSNGMAKDGKVNESKVNESKVNESKVNESKVNESKVVAKATQYPTLEQVKEYCLERKNQVDAIRFFDFYQSKGWMVGKNKMKDWRACVRTWERSDSSFQKGVKNDKSEWTNGIDRSELEQLLNDGRE